jgi:hypothetical protein
MTRILAPSFPSAAKNTRTGLAASSKQFQHDQEIQVKKLVSITAILLFSVITACGGGGADPRNLLLGKWKLFPDDVHSKYCLATMEFTAKTYTGPDVNGKLFTIPVTYVTGDPKTLKFPATVYVLTDAGVDFHTTYLFSTKDKMMLNTGLMCSYTRQ